MSYRTSYEPPQCPFTPLGSAEADSVDCVGSAGNGGDGTGVVGRLVALVPFIGMRAGWGDNTDRGEVGRGGTGEFGREVGVGEWETLPTCG